MITTIFKCDKCGKEQNTPEQMWEIEVHINHYSTARNYASPTSKKGQLWCRECIEKLGLAPSNNPEIQKQIQEKAPTLEDIVREICRDEIANAQEGR